MPEPTAPPPPVPTPPPPAPAPAPAPSPTPEPPKSTASMMDELDALVAAPKTEPKPDKPAAPKGPSKPPEPPKTPPKAADAPPPPKVEPKEQKDPVALRKRLAEIEAEYSGFKLTAQQEKDKLAAKIAAFEKQTVLTPDHEKQLERAKQLEAELYSRDYRESPEFADKYQKKWQSAYKTAVSRINGAGVEFENAEGVKEVRRATEADFQKIMHAQPSEQLELAEKLFGKYAFIVMQDINGLRSIEEAANEDVSTRSKEYHSKVSEFQKRMRDEESQFKGIQQSVDAELVQKYPEFFGEDEAQPEATNALKKGLELVDRSLNDAAQLTVQERASKAAVLRRWAGAFPRLVLTINQLKLQLQAKDEELAKYRASDPGSGGDDGHPTPSKPSGPQTTADLVSALEEKL